MIPYPKYTTTVIGAHSVPDWYEALDRLLAVGQLSMSSMADAHHRSTQAAVLDQELGSTSSPAAKCTGGPTTVTPRPMPC
jgi:hypothetical protein